MENSTLTYRTANTRIEEYRAVGDKAMADHVEAMESYDCEAFLALGIEAFNWLVRATREWRDRELRESPAIPADDPIRDLRKMWLAPCENAERWIAVQQKRNYELRNLREFRECCDKMKQLVARDNKIREIAARIPSMEDLSEGSLSPPREWTEEASWSH